MDMIDNNEQKKFTAIIYGCGKMYEKYKPYFELYKDVLDYKGLIVSECEEYVFDGFSVKSANEMDFSEIDYIFVTSNKYFREICDNLTDLGVPDKKIVPCNVFELPYFDITKYLFLKQQDVTILSNYCLGGLIYKELGLRALSPTINMICDGIDFIKFCNNYKMYLSNDMEALDDGISCSQKYKWNDRHRFVPKGKVLDIVWNLVHEADANEGIQKWNRRRIRVNFDNVVVVMIIQNEEELNLFNKLNFKRKIGVFYKKTVFDSVISLTEWSDAYERQKHDYKWHVYANNNMVNIKGKKGKVDWIKFLIGEKDYYINMC